MAKWQTPALEADELVLVAIARFRRVASFFTWEGIFLLQCSVARWPRKLNERTDRMSEKTVTWVIYLMTVRKQEGMKAVCEQAEWDAMELARPGYHQLIQGGFTNEAEAELLARGESGASKPRTAKPR
jgi:hypothetical protein